jgi:uncharacterized membrane protein YhaH (DUF805 family)
MKYIKAYWQNTFNYRDATSRKDYWLQVLFNDILWLVVFVILTFVIGILLGLFSGDVTDDTVTGAAMATIGILGIVNLLPAISLTVRRVRDATNNPWLTFLYFVPVVGGLIILGFMVLPTANED